MKRIYFEVLSLLIMVSACTPSLINLSDAKENVRVYYENGAYENELSEIAENTIAKLNDIKLTSNSTVVFDVDETILSNYEHIKEVDFGFKLDLWKEWIEKSKATAINPTKKIYKWCVKNNVKVVFLTGRFQNQYQFTYRNLLLQGFTKIDTLICRKEDESKLSAAVYKTNERKILTDKGYEIIASIGDSETDIKGEFTGLKIKLPNYLYKIK